MGIGRDVERKPAAGGPRSTTAKATKRGGRGAGNFFLILVGASG